MTAFREPFPILVVDDVEAAGRFYCSVLGFEETYRNEDEHGVEFAYLALEPSGIGLARRHGDEPGPVALWLYADDVDSAAAALRAAGATELSPPTDQPWGERVCSYVDPHGLVVHVGQRL